MSNTKYRKFLAKWSIDDYDWSIEPLPQLSENTNIKCDKCNGTEKLSTEICLKCGGLGKVDWIQNLKNKNFDKNWTNEIINDWAKEIRKRIDEEILRGLSVNKNELER